MSLTVCYDKRGGSDKCVLLAFLALPMLSITQVSEYE